MSDQNPDQETIDKIQKQAYLDRVNAFANSVKLLATIAHIAGYEWMSDGLREKVAGHEAKRAGLKKQAAEIVQPVFDTVNNLGNGGEFDLFAAIEGATLAQKSLFSQIALAATEGEAIAREAVAEVTPLVALADDEATRILEDRKEALAKEGWPMEVHGNEDAFLHYCKRNVRYQQAARAARELSGQKQSLFTEASALANKVGEVKRAAAKSAMRELSAL